MRQSIHHNIFYSNYESWGIYNYYSSTNYVYIYVCITMNDQAIIGKWIDLINVKYLDRQSNTYIDEQVGGFDIHTQVDRQIGRQIYRQVDRQVGRQIGRQIDRCIKINVSVYISRCFLVKHDMDLFTTNLNHPSGESMCIICSLIHDTNIHRKISINLHNQ